MKDRNEVKENDHLLNLNIQISFRYLCGFNNDKLIWMSLDKEHQKVREYEHYLRTKVQPQIHNGLLLVTPANAHIFFQSPFIDRAEEYEPETNTNTHKNNTTTKYKQR